MRALQQLRESFGTTTTSWASNVLPRDSDDLATVAPDPDELATRPQTARLKQRITEFLINRLFGLIGRRAPRLTVGDHNIIDFSSSSVMIAIDIIYATSASVTLMLSIVILYFVHSSGIRLVIIGVFTLCSSGGLCSAYEGNTYRDLLFYCCVGVHCRDRHSC